MDARKQRIFHLLGQTVHVEIDRSIGHIHKGMTYPINYGYIPGLLAGDGEDQDVYVLGVDIPLTSFDGQVIGAICRKDDVEDKLVVAPAGLEFHQGELAKATHFQEQYFDTAVISLFHKSCGVLPWREAAGQREYLLVFEQFSQCWSLPKGHMEAGETEVQTALRELREETGLTARLDSAHRAVIEYPISPVGRKQVVFFPGQVSGIPRVRPGEIERFKWVTADELDAHLFPDTAAACRKLISGEK
jgi:8-oxo-dGTP pyrophosphatase MutT (NUDIX family)